MQESCFIRLNKVRLFLSSLQTLDLCDFSGFRSFGLSMSWRWYLERHFSAQVSYEYLRFTDVVVIELVPLFFFGVIF